MRCGVAQSVARVGDTPPVIVVKALAICLRGRYFTRPLPSLPLRTQPM